MSQCIIFFGKFADQTLNPLQKSFVTLAQFNATEDHIKKTYVAFMQRHATKGYTNFKYVAIAETTFSELRTLYCYNFSLARYFCVAFI